jgi:putative two-component system response regulator
MNDSFKGIRSKRGIIMIVDDNITSLKSGKEALSDLYDVVTVPSTQKMLEIIGKNRPDLILLDILMPEMDGFEAIQLLKQNYETRDIPVIFLTAKSDPETEIRGFDLGAVDFINKPFSHPVLRRRIEMHLHLDEIVKRRTAQLRQMQSSIVSVLSNLVEERDKMTGGHIERTQLYISILIDAMRKSGCYAEEMGGWNMEILQPSAQLHDVGKISVSDTILNKPGKLTDEEFEIMKSHASEGESIIDNIMINTSDDGYFLYAKIFAGTHHEKWDGSGYPRGTKGENIPLQGRIMAIADVYDALVSERPYKRPFSHEKAVEIIVEGAGHHFDPKIVEVFQTISDKFRQAQETTLRELVHS